MKTYKSLIAGLCLAFICTITINANAATPVSFLQDKMSKMSGDTSKMKMKMDKKKMKMDKKKIKMAKKMDASKMDKM